MSVSIGKLAEQFDCEVHGDPETLVARVGTLQAAAADAITFLANPSYRSMLASTGAAAVILEQDAVAECPVAALVTSDPYGVYARIATFLHPPTQVVAGVHAAAVIGNSCNISSSAEIAAGAVLADNVTVGERVYIGPNSILADGVSVGDDTRLMGNVSLYRDVQIGQRCLLHSGVVIGSDGFGVARDKAGAWTKVPQVGAVRVGNDVEIGSNTAIDRGAIEDTVIGDGVKLDNMIQIGHNVVIGAHTAIAGQVGISGSSTIGERCMLGGQSGVAGHISIANDVVIAGRTMVTHSVREPGMYAGGGVPMQKAEKWRKNAVRFTQLDKMSRSLRRLEQAVFGDKDASEK